MLNRDVISKVRFKKLFILLIVTWFVIGFSAGYIVNGYQHTLSTKDLKTSIAIHPSDKVYYGKIVFISVIDTGDKLLYMYSIQYRVNSTEYVNNFLSKNNAFKVGDYVFIVVNSSGDIVKIGEW